MLLLLHPHAYTLQTLSEASWRKRADAHTERMRALLSPGFVPATPPPLTSKGLPSVRVRGSEDGWLALSTTHPVYNFLEEYYHIRGAKGTRKLARFSAGPAVTLQGATEADLGGSGGVLSSRGATLDARGITFDAAAAHAASYAADATPYLWHRDVLAATAAAEPVLSCYGLHEWAMQYWPEGAPEPPSAIYQAHMRLRVPREVVNQVVERRGVRCTHVDALRFFAPAAGKLNAHGASLRRDEQLVLEQPGCVHAHMDLLKMALRLSPYLEAELLADCLEIALDARTLDVAASPYDATDWGLAPVCIEAPEGRQSYREQQEDLMRRAAPVRAALLLAYDDFLLRAFGEERLLEAGRKPADERFAVATPGGEPWKRSLIARE